jgi:hypothetical protein
VVRRVRLERSDREERQVALDAAGHDVGHSPRRLGGCTKPGR